MDRVKPYLLLILLSAILFATGLASLPVIDRDEAHFAQATRQMLQTGNYFQIRFQETTRFQKPPGINWLQAASVSLLSDSEASAIWPYRVPSLLGALLAVVLTYYFARRLICPEVALWGAALLASSLLLLIETHMAVIDTSLLASVLGMQGALWVIYAAALKQQKVAWGWALLFWLAMAWGFALKGVTPLVGTLTVVTLCCVDKRVRWLRGLHAVSGLLVFCLLSVTWLYFVNEAEHSNYLLQMIHNDLLPKLQGGHESHGQPPLFHLLILPLMFWPGSLLFWRGGVFAYTNRSTPAVRFLLAWIIPTWVFFEIMPSKLPQYVLPTFPAIALLCSLALQTCKDNITVGKWEHGMQIGWVILSLALCAGVTALSYYFRHTVDATACVIGLLVPGLLLGCIYYAWQGRYHQAVVGLLVVSLVTYPMLFGYALPRLSPLWVSRNAVESINKDQLSEQNPLLVVGFTEPSTVFYLNTKQIRFLDANEALDSLKRRPDSLLLIEESHIANRSLPSALTVLRQTRGFNYSKGHWVNLLLIGRAPPKGDTFHASIGAFF